MTFSEFFEKNKKIIIIVVIIICAILVGVLITKFWGGLVGLFGTIWALITKKKSTDQIIHDEKIKNIDDQIAVLKQKEAELVKGITTASADEKVIRENVEKVKDKYKNMSLDEMIKEHNKSIGINP